MTRFAEPDETVTAAESERPRVAGGHLFLTELDPTQYPGCFEYCVEIGNEEYSGFIGKAYNNVLLCEWKERDGRRYCEPRQVSVRILNSTLFNNNPELFGQDGQYNTFEIADRRDIVGVWVDPGPFLTQNSETVLFQQSRSIEMETGNVEVSTLRSDNGNVELVFPHGIVLPSKRMSEAIGGGVWYGKSRNAGEVIVKLTESRYGPEDRYKEVSSMIHIENKLRSLVNNENGNLTDDEVRIVREGSNYIVRLLSAFSLGMCMCIVMPLRGKDTWLDFTSTYIRHNNSPRRNFMKLRGIEGFVRKLLVASITLWLCRVCHLDFSLENVVMVKRLDYVGNYNESYESYDPLIIDFGVCERLDPTFDDLLPMSQLTRANRRYYTLPYEGHSGEDVVSSGPAYHIWQLGASVFVSYLGNLAIQDPAARERWYAQLQGQNRENFKRRIENSFPGVNMEFVSLIFDMLNPVWRYRLSDKDALNRIKHICGIF